MNSLLHTPSHTRPEAMAAALTALAHPTRIAILKHLACADACCCKEVVGRLDLAQSTVSQHLKVLVEAGLVRFAAERPRSRYSVDREALATLSKSLSELLSSCCDGPAR